MNHTVRGKHVERHEIRAEKSQMGVRYPLAIFGLILQFWMQPLCVGKLFAQKVITQDSLSSKKVELKEKSGLHVVYDSVTYIILRDGKYYICQKNKLKAVLDSENWSILEVE